MSETNGNYVGGEWTIPEDGETFESINPAHTAEVIGVFHASTADDAHEGIKVAKEAQPDWADTPAPKRGELLVGAAERIADKREAFATLITKEQGQALSDADSEVGLAIALLRYYAQKAKELGGTEKASSSAGETIRTVKTPVGVASVITPWNVPLSIPVWKIAPALVTGNTVVWKPASSTAAVAEHLMQTFETAGVPDGVLNLVFGSGSELGDPLVTDPSVDAVSFTGSTHVGDIIYQNAAANRKRIQMEMGGKNPAVVMPSADLERAVKLIGNGAFARTGQACTATSRVIVHEAVHDEFLGELVEYANSLTIGPGEDDEDIGPHASKSELESTLEYVAIGQEEGATLETGGKHLTEVPYDDGYYVEPAVFSDVDNDMRIATEEIFGPVVGVIPTTSFEEALAIANDTEFGLSASIMTDSLAEADRFVEGAEAGVVKVNGSTTGAEPQVPFGGMKRSSAETVREMGEAGLEFFTLEKTVYINR